MKNTLPPWVEKLARVAGDSLKTDAETLATYGRDWTREHAPNASGVAFPRTTNEVAAILRFANDERVPVVPSGGRTGLAGGAVAKDGELVLSLEKMNAMHAVDVLGRTVRVQAGAITEAVHKHAAASGLTWPIDFASKGSSHIGGNIATNAGGVRVIRWGMTRHWVLGLEVVLADGRILDVGGALEKDNTGMDLRQLFIGSEGILGVITEATLKLAPLPGPARVMFFAVHDLSSVLALFRAVGQSGVVTNAFELMTRQCMDRVLVHRKLADPFPTRSSHYVLWEAEEHPALDAFITRVLEQGLVNDGVVAMHQGEAERLWALRESIAESLTRTGVPHKNDIALPISALEGFSAELTALLASQSYEICVFGHIGDGNLHINLMKPDGMTEEAFFEAMRDADRAMFSLVKKHKGSISAEHGIGLLKRDFLSYSRTADEIALMRSLKATLDPHGILNPGKVL